MSPEGKGRRKRKRRAPPTSTTRENVKLKGKKGTPRFKDYRTAKERREESSGRKLIRVRKKTGRGKKT